MLNQCCVARVYEKNSVVFFTIAYNHVVNLDPYNFNRSFTSQCNNISVDLSKIQNRPYVFFDLKGEAYDKTVYSIIEHFSQEYNYPLHRIIFRTGNLAAKENYSGDINVLCIPSVLFHVRNIQHTINLDRQIDKTYLCLNRKVLAPEEVIFRSIVSSILLSKYKDDLIISYGEKLPHQKSLQSMLKELYYFPKDQIEKFMTEYKSGIDLLVKNSPYVLDMELNDNNRMESHASPELETLHTTTLINLVTESSITANDPEYEYGFITEKTWRPIAYGQPTFIFGTPNTYKHLKEMGFAGFENFFNTDYDTEKDHLTRLQKAFKTLDKLSLHSLSKEDQREWLHQGREVLQHNQEWLLKGGLVDSCRNKLDAIIRQIQ